MLYNVKSVWTKRNKEVVVNCCGIILRSENNIKGKREEKPDPFIKKISDALVPPWGRMWYLDPTHLKGGRMWYLDPTHLQGRPWFRRTNPSALWSHVLCDISTQRISKEDLGLGGRIPVHWGLTSSLWWPWRSFKVTQKMFKQCPSCILWR